MVPIIGVFVSVGQVRKANLQKPHFRLKELVNANKEVQSILYFFSVKDVDFSSQQIRGTYYNDKTDQWEQREYPYPDILYDRGGGTLKSQKKKSSEIRGELEKNRQLKKINPRYYFDKWEVYAQLAKYREMRQYLPKTILYKSPQDLRIMFDWYLDIYIKDCHANNGKGIFRVRKLPFGEFELSYCKSKLTIHIYKSFDKLVRKIDTLLADKKVILQNAIDILEVDKGSVDIRSLVQRNGKGDLEVGFHSVRIGRIGYPITNIRTGSSAFTLDYFINNRLHIHDKKTIEELNRKIFIFLAPCFGFIEDTYGAFGEIGIDFALDKNLNIWFIECNAKPGKDTLYHAYDADVAKKAFLNPLEYGKYLFECICT